MRRRQSNRSLTATRIYPRGKKFYYFSPEPIENPATGRVSKWIPLCPIDKGEHEARHLVRVLLKHNERSGEGDLPLHVEAYRLKVVAMRQKERPKDPQRAKLWEEGTKEFTRECRRFAEAFDAFNVEQVDPVDVAKFLDQWEGQRMAQVWRRFIVQFFAWCARRGLRNDNPAREVSVSKPKKRKRYIHDGEYHAIRDSALVGLDGKQTPSGKMLQCYIDLCYLLYQRTTDVRLLKWSQVDWTAGVIHFTPTKTEHSSGVSVDIPISGAIRAVLERARAIGVVKSLYVIHTLRGTPYASRGIGTAWERARERAGVEPCTLKDLRAKALTDAKKRGYQIEQLKVAAAHTDAATTEIYIKDRLAETSEVMLDLPPRIS